MAFLDRLDIEHRAALEALPGGLLELGDINNARVRHAGMQAPLDGLSEATSGVSVSDHGIKLVDGHEMMIRLYHPPTADTPRPALYWMHGGGFVMGSVSTNDAECSDFAQNLGCVVASVEYRLAPEHPHPLPINDCYEGLKWLFRNADAFAVDCSRVAVGGRSAGAGLAASLSLLARDQERHRLLFQLLIAPMLDDRNITPSSHYVTEPRVWNREANIIAWNALLGSDTGSNNVSAYAAAGRATNLRGLPPAYISVGELDLFLDEDIEYASRLLRAQVSTEFHVYPGAFHGSDRLVRDSELSKRQIADRKAALHRAFQLG